MLDAACSHLEAQLGKNLLSVSFRLLVKFIPGIVETRPSGSGSHLFLLCGSGHITEASFFKVIRSISEKAKVLL